MKFYKKHKDLTVLLLVTAGILLVAHTIRTVFRHQRLSIPEPVAVYIPSGSNFDQLCDTLRAHQCLADEHVFRSVAKVRGLDQHVKAGRYVLEPRMTLMHLVRKLYSGNQDPLSVTINRHRTNEQLCAFLGKKLEFSPDSLSLLLHDPEVCQSYGCTPQTIISIFIQNTYEIYWTTTPRQLLDRMAKESDHFWTAVRTAQCHELHLSPQEVITLASIVEEETNQNDEKAQIASVYLNRLRKGMLLQADPTVKYATGDFSLRRILGIHLKTDSPYNTYLYKGLPPGPICNPSVASIDAVLENLNTNYLYFCAKEDFSGHHNFAATISEHMANARRFHQVLNQRGIK